MTITDRRVFITSNLRRDADEDINNDIIVTLPDSIFSGKIQNINMSHMFIDYSVETLGTSNYEFLIAYPETNNFTPIALDISNLDSQFIQTDDELAGLIADSINSTLGTTVFQVFFNKIITSNSDIYRDNSDMLSSYTIFTSNNVNFNIDFSSKNSIGPLIGFGNEIYRSAHSYKGGNIPPIYAYESIYISNKAYSPSFKEFDQPTDIACKMDMYDSNNNLITNYLDERDTTISLPIVNGYISNVNQFVELIQTELNRYSSSFANNPNFAVSFNPSTYRFTITNNQNVKFGIGFRFNRPDGTNNYGSLHRHLGFDKTLYLGYTSITSTKEAKIFDRAYISEYLFVCSDLIKFNYDETLIVTESAGNASFYESLFTIPITLIINGSYTPSFENQHKVRIHSSWLAKQYNEDSKLSKTINFYLKLSSGRHIKLNTQWSLNFHIEYTN